MLYSSFQDYVTLYTKTYKDEDGKNLSIVYEQCGHRWHVAAAASAKGFQHVSFVNRCNATSVLVFFLGGGWWGGGGGLISYVSEFLT